VSWKAIELAMAARERAPSLTSTELLVLLGLAYHENPRSREAFPSTAKLVAELKLSRRTIVAALKRLRGLGLIDVVRTSTYDRPAVYRLTDIGSRGATTAPGATAASHGVHDTTAGVQETASRGASAAPKPLLTETEPKETRGIKKDNRPAWQKVKDAQAEAEHERTRTRTADELAEIERKRAWVEELDRRETERRDRELEAETAAAPEPSDAHLTAAGVRRL
jgi:DNA-binding MarR family transcriptional regulator